MNAFVAKNVIAQATKAEEESARKQAMDSPNVSSSVDMMVMTPTTVSQIPIPLSNHTQENVAGGDSMAVSPPAPISTLSGLNFIQQKPSNPELIHQNLFFKILLIPCLISMLHSLQILFPNPLLYFLTIPLVILPWRPF